MRFFCSRLLLSRGAAFAPCSSRPILELEEPGAAELDVQLGVIRSRGPWRVVMPDFELDLGLLENLELDIDGAYAIEGPEHEPRARDPLVFGSRTMARPEAGLDFARLLDDHGRYSLTAEVSAVHFTSGEPAQLLTTLGASVSPKDAIDLSVVALAGLLEGSDRYGVLLGVSPHFRVR